MSTYCICPIGGVSDDCPEHYQLAQERSCTCPLGAEDPQCPEHQRQHEIHAFQQARGDHDISEE